MKTGKVYLTVIILLLVSQNIFSQSIKKGTWDRQNKSISGSWEIVTKDDGNYIVFSDDFKTKKAHDLELFLSKEKASEVNKKKILKEAISISKLKSHKDGQSYKIPSHINLKEFSSIIIHCRDYNIFWGAGNL